MTGTDASDEGDAAAHMSEWMKVMLDEMERKRAEHEEASAELAKRAQPGEHGGDDAERPGEPKDPSSTA